MFKNHLTNIKIQQEGPLFPPAGGIFAGDLSTSTTGEASPGKYHSSMAWF